MTTTIVTRLGKGSALTWLEADTNFTNLKATADLALQLATTTFTSVSVGVAPASGGGTTNFLRADGTWAAPSGSGATDLAYVTATRTITSSTGTDAVLPTVASADAGLAPASGGGTTNFLRADGTWAVPPGSASSTTSVLDAQGIAFHHWSNGSGANTSGHQLSFSSQGTGSTGTLDTTNYYNQWPHGIFTSSGNTYGFYSATFLYCSSTAGNGGFDIIVVTGTGTTFNGSPSVFVGLGDDILNTFNPFTKDIPMFGLACANNSATPSENQNWHTITHALGSGVWTRADTGVARTSNQIIWQRFYNSPGSTTIYMDAYLVDGYNSVTTLATGYSGTPFTSGTKYSYIIQALGGASHSVRYYKAHGVIYGLGNPY